MATFRLQVVSMDGLEYDGEKWLIIPDAALIHALSGGIAN